MHDPLLGILGICRRAGKLSMGRDMAIDSVMKNASFLVLISTSSSDRLEAEFQRAAAACRTHPVVVRVPYSIDILHKAVGYKAGVFSVNDGGFAAKMLALLHPPAQTDDSSNGAAPQTQPKEDNIL